MKSILGGRIKRVLNCLINENKEIKLNHDEKICPNCNGEGFSGYLLDFKCWMCNGKGKLKS